MAGGKELLRVMLSKDAATNFAKTKLAPTIVKGTRAGRRLRLDRAGLADQDARRRRAATSSPGSSSTYYGMNTDQLVLWNTLPGTASPTVADLTKGLQDITDKVANDTSVKKIEVK